MQSSSLAVDFLSRPYLVLKHESLRQYYSQHEEKCNSADWSQSRLNPANRVNSLDTSSSKWRVDGATACATQFFIVPLDLLHDLEPLRIDVFIRDQLQHPPHLREDLGSNLSVSLQNNRALARLGISRHLCRALDEQCLQDPSFLTRYRKLPFGSRLVFTSINSNPQKMELLVLPAFDLEREALSVRSLQTSWPDIPREQWPEVVDLSHLRFVHQIHESITLVHLVDEVVEGGRQFVFKSNTEHLTYLYNELRFLLRCPPHPNIMSAPIRLVTKRSNFGGKVGVFGFLLPYYSQGSIRDILPSLSPKNRLKICLEVTAAMIHICERCKTFYSDLRPDNVLFSSEPHSRAVLCDFEQRGNHYDWCPPEVLPSLYLENIQSSNDEGALRKLEEWVHIIKGLSHTKHSPSSQRSLSKEGGHSLNRPWASLGRFQQESAMVYALGLFIYAIFEGLGDLQRGVLHSYPTDSNSIFPQMRHAPLRVREIIWKCTRSAPEWGGNEWSAKEFSANTNRLSQKGGYIVRTEMDHSSQSIHTPIQVTMDDIINSALQWWRAKLAWVNDALGNPSNKNNWGSDRPRLREVLTALQDINIDDI
ncbi:hypothetical protein F4781DRAFT_419008 [Annulohypoxylon bovei var. microspora]|nr:hypothetical protein F4781DRAFT_419008 [Annulohypoxylon bovei var. microspora]